MLITIIIFLIIIITIILNPKVKLYDLILEGIKNGFKQVIGISIPIISITILIELFLNSGIIDLLYQVLPFSHIPSEIYLQLLIKPISYNSSFIFMNQVFIKYGINHLFAYLSTLIQGAFDSTIFVCVLYFNEIKNQLYKKTLYSSLFINFISTIFAIGLWIVFF